MLVLRLFLQLRSPSWGARRRFVVGVEHEIVERCAKHITGLLNLYVHKPVMGFAWKRYLEDALAALDPRTVRVHPGRMAVQGECAPLGELLGAALLHWGPSSASVCRLAEMKMAR